MRRLLALAALSLMQLTAAPAFAQDIPADAEHALSCSTIFSVKADDARDAGDGGTATELSYRSDELNARGVLILQGAGFTDADIENVLMNTAMKVGFLTGAGEPPYSDEECFALME